MLRQRSSAGSVMRSTMTRALAVASWMLVPALLSAAAAATAATTTRFLRRCSGCDLRGNAHRFGSCVFYKSAKIKGEFD